MTDLERTKISELIAQALIEDLGDGDHTSLAIIPEHANGKVKLVAKEIGIIAGVEVASIVFKQVDKNLVVKIFISD